MYTKLGLKGIKINPAFLFKIFFIFDSFVKRIILVIFIKQNSFAFLQLELIARSVGTRESRIQSKPMLIKCTSVKSALLYIFTVFAMIYYKGQHVINAGKNPQMVIPSFSFMHLFLLKCGYFRPNYTSK